MKTIEAIHRENLESLAAEFGGVTTVAAMIGCSSSQYSQWMNGSENSGTGKPRGMRPSSARRIEKACAKPEGWMDREHAEVDARNSNYDDSPFIESTELPEGMSVRVGEGPQTVAIPAVKFKLRAGVSGFVAEPDMDIDHGTFQVPMEVIDELRLNRKALYVVSVKGASMEPMMVDGDKVLIDTSKKTPIHGETYALNWNGEPIIKRLLKKGDSWTLFSWNRDPEYHTIDVRSGQCSIIGMVVWQPARIVKGRF